MPLTRTADVMRAWRATWFLKLTFATHAAALIILLVKPAAWPWAVIAVLGNHALITIVGLWPKSTLLGPNILRLPETSAARGEVAITIDDGPDPEITPRVLRILAEHDARATFFLIGQRAAAHPDLCRRIVAAGHSIENHGQLHRKSSSLLGYRGWLREVGSAQDTLAALTGRQPRFFRAAAGLRNPFLEPALCRHGLQLTAWTRRGFDTIVGNPEWVLSRLTRNLVAGDILLLHDGHCARTLSGTPVILDVLPRLLSTLAARRLKPVTLQSACRLS